MSATATALQSFDADFDRYTRQEITSIAQHEEVYGSTGVKNRVRGAEPETEDDRSSSPSRLFDVSDTTIMSRPGQTSCVSGNESYESHKFAEIGDSPATSPPGNDTEAGISGPIDTSSLKPTADPIATHEDSDLDDSESDSGSQWRADKGGQDRHAFLESFRKRFRNEGSRSLDREPSTSSLFSGTLSDPPTSGPNASSNDGIVRVAPLSSQSSSQQQPVSPAFPAITPLAGASAAQETAHDLPLQRFDAKKIAVGDTTSNSSGDEPSSPYITEQQKRTSHATDTSARARRLKELATKARDRTMNNSTDSDEGISSSSDVEIEDGSAPLRRRHGKAKGQAQLKRFAKGLAGTKGKDRHDKTLLLQAEDSSTDEELGADSAEKPTGIKALSKKEIEKMDQMRARLEREAKVRLSRQRPQDRPRPVFGLKDLIANIAATEAKGLKTSINKAEDLKAGSPSSDPIESSGSEEGRGEIGKQGNGGQHTTFLVKMKEKLATGGAQSCRGEADVENKDDEDLPDSGAMVKEVISEKAEKGKKLALRTLKMQALQSAGIGAIAQSKAAEDLELYHPVICVETPTKPNPRQASNADSGSYRIRGQESASPGTGNTALMLASGGEEVPLSSMQIRKAHKVLFAEKKSKDASENISQKVPSRMTKRTPERTRSRLTQKQLLAVMNEKISRQNSDARRKGEIVDGHLGKSLSSTIDEETPDLRSLLQRLQSTSSALEERDAGEGSDVEEDDSDFDPDAEEEEANAIDYGSASEAGSDGSGERAQEIQALDGDVSPIASLSDAAEEDAVVPAKRRTRLLVKEGVEEDDEIFPQGESLNQEATDPRLNASLDTMHKFASAESSSVSGERELIDGRAYVTTNGEDGAGFSQFFAETQTLGKKGDHSPVLNTSATLGRFFNEGTQSEAASHADSRGILSHISEGQGFTQVFEDGTQSIDNDRVRMPPPATSARGASLFADGSNDSFAAMRRNEANAAGLINDGPADLPSLDGAFNQQELNDIMALEDEAVRADEEDRLLRMESMRRNSDIAYLNRDGFFTQTRPDDLSFIQTQTQTQADSQLTDFAPTNDSAAPEMVETAAISPQSLLATKDSPVPARRKRLRRAISAKRTINDEENDAITEDGADSSPLQKSLAVATPMIAKNGARAGIEDETGRSSRAMRETAFDVLHAGQKAEKDREMRSRIGRFLEGEAEESDGDSDSAVKKNSTDHGGLGGIFSDEGSSDDEDDDDEDDGRDVDNLIDEERDEDEAEKDRLARERYLRDIDADDQAAQALHEKAIRGGFRNRRRGRNEDGTIGDFLEDDYEDDWLEKKARNPYGAIAKKRRLQGKDGMDALAESEESQAFVLQYRDSYHPESTLDKYSFLQAAEDDETVMQDLYGSDQQAQRRLEAARNEGGDEDGSGQSDAEQPQKMTRKELQEEVAAIRRRQKRRNQGLLDDEDIEASESRRREQLETSRAHQLQVMLERALMPDYSDEEGDNDMLRVQDRLRGDGERQEAEEAMASIEDDEESSESIAQFGLKGLGGPQSVSDRERARLERLAKDFENEPEWQSAQVARSNRNKSTGTSHLANRAGNIRPSADIAGPPSSTSLPPGKSNAPARPVPIVSSKLRGVMSRQTRFSTNHSGEVSD